jgi:hypothetical protein
MSERQHPSNEMVLTVAGQDCTAGLGAEIASAAQAIDNPAMRNRISGESEILALGHLANESDFLDRHLALSGNRTQISLATFKLPEAGTGLRRIAGAIRTVLWRLMRHPHDWTVFHQNTINLQTLSALELEVRLRRREAEQLRERLSALEVRCKELECTPS